VTGRLWLALFLTALMLWPRGALPAASPWYPATEPSPFIPEAARWVVGGPAKLTHFRGVWQVRGEVRRAVLCVAPYQTTRVVVNGRLVAESWDTHQARPRWVELSGRLQPGPVFVAARVASEWTAALYAQMRVEYADGTWEDLTTGPGWEWCDAPAEDWATNPQAAGQWQAVKDAGGYAIEGAAFWGREFALLPRALLSEHFRAHNDHLRGAWETDRTAPGLKLK
jgi:hypothetical protein